MSETATASHSGWKIAFLASCGAAAPSLAQTGECPAKSQTQISLIFQEEERVMKISLLRCLAIAGLLALAPAAFAVGLDGFEYQKDIDVTMKSGKTVTLKIGKMDGKTVVVLPMEDLDYLYERAEGHTMATGP